MQLRFLYRDDCLTLAPDPFGRDRIFAGRNNRRSMKGLITAVGLVLLFACQTFADEHSAFARITVYWHREGSGEHASWNGARLRTGHCAVDPKKIPYASKVVFPDATCVAIDSGPGVVSRKSARSCGRNAAERNALVIDRFFDTKQEALTWAKAHPHFMTVQIVTPGAKEGKVEIAEDPGSSRRPILPATVASILGTAE